MRVREGANIGDIRTDFDAWYEGERKALARNPNWTSRLPACPARIPTDPAWTRDSELVIDLFHPGAASCFRSDGSPRQQCCYDAAGRLITSGASAGTPDRSGDLIDHIRMDVMPFLWARKLDGGNRGKYFKRWLEARPPNQGR